MTALLEITQQNEQVVHVAWDLISANMVCQMFHRKKQLSSQTITNPNLQMCSCRCTPPNLSEFNRVPSAMQIPHFTEHTTYDWIKMYIKVDRPQFVWLCLYSHYNSEARIIVILETKEEHFFSKGNCSAVHENLAL